MDDLHTHSEQLEEAYAIDEFRTWYTGRCIKFSQYIYFIEEYKNFKENDNENQV